MFKVAICDFKIRIFILGKDIMRKAQQTGV